MNKTRYLWIAAALVSVVFLFSTSAWSAGIKQRMKDRLPQIIALKAAGVIGETNQGYLAFVGAKKQAAALVDAENNDRQQVYNAIAKQQGTSAAVVGRRRALQIAEKAKPGEWLQDATGKWYRRK
jgi:uncharacterized protein YdbL (DUF1318 family)